MEWFADPVNSKSLGLLIFFVTFCMIVLWVYGRGKQSRNLEEHKNIPFLDDEAEVKDESNGRER